MIELLLLVLIIALVAGAVGGPRIYRRRPTRVVYDDPVVDDVYDAPVRRRRRFF